MKQICICILSLFFTTIAFAQTIKKIPFEQAKNYFVKNSFKKNSIKNYKIESQQQFENIFGMATVMGEKGKPTGINFSKQFVIAVIEDETDLDKKLLPVSLEKNKNKELILSVETKTGQKQTYTSRPFILLIVDKQYDGKVIILKNK